MTNIELFKAIGDVDEELLEELEQIPEKKRRKVFGRNIWTGRRMAAAMAVCAGFVFCMLLNQIVSELHFQKGTKPEVAERQSAIKFDEMSEGEGICSDTADDRADADEGTLQKKEEDNDSADLQVNHLDSLYGNAKFGGHLKSVSEGQWQKQYGKEAFLTGRKVEYLLSYNEQKEVLYGVAVLQWQKDKLEMRVSDGKMLDSSFKDLKKTKIGRYEIALCVCDGVGNNLAAIVQGQNAIYTIEESEMGLEDFSNLLEEVFAHE